MTDDGFASMVVAVMDAAPFSLTPAEDQQLRFAIFSALTLVWNTRGAADIAKIESGLPEAWSAAAPVGELTRALRTLDR